MVDFTKMQKDRILNHLYKNYKKIDFDNIDQEFFFKKQDCRYSECLINYISLICQKMMKKALKSPCSNKK